MNASLLGHFVAEQGVDHAVAGGLHFGGEGVRGDDEAAYASQQTRTVGG